GATGATGATGPSLVAGASACQVIFASSATAVSGSVNLVWDNTNSRLGISAAAPSGALTVGAAPTATTSYGLVSLGAGPFDGTSTGHFAGTGPGTVVAVNTASGFGGNLVDYQVAGV